MKPTTPKRRIKRSVIRGAIEAAAVLAADAALYSLALRPAAIAERGSTAFGGELAFLIGAPLIYDAIRSIIRCEKEAQG